MPIIISWFINTVGTLIAIYIMPGIVVDTFSSALIVALLIGVVNSLFAPLVSSMHMHTTLITVGFPTFIASLFMIVALGGAISGFRHAGYWSAFLLAFLLAIVGYTSSLLAGGGQGGH